MSGILEYRTHELLDEFKKGSNLFKFYEHFKILNNVSYDSYINCFMSNDPKIKGNCQNVNQIIQKWKSLFETFQRTENNTSEKCHYLVLWAYDRIKQCSSKAFCTSWFYSLLEEFWKDKKFCHDVTQTNEFKKKYKKTFNLEILKNKRELYDFLEYFNNISSILKDNKSDKKQKYCKYVSDIFQLYKEIIKKSCSGNYDYEIEKFQELVINKEEILNILKDNCPNHFQDVSFIKNNSTKCISKESSNKNEESHHLSTHSDTDNIESRIRERPSIKFSDHENLLKKIHENDNLYGSYFYKKYENLDKTVHNDNTVNTKFESLKSNYNDISDNVLKKLIKNIIHLNNIKDANEYRKSCLYYKYWTYEKMWMIWKKKSNYGVEKVIDKFLDLHSRVISKTTNGYMCEFHFYVKNLEQLEYLVEQRHLDIYFKIYPFIKSNIYCTMDKKDRYVKYLDYISPLYKIHKGDCCLHYNIWGDYECHNYFKCHDKYNPDNLLHALNYVGNNDCNNFLKTSKPQPGNSDNSQKYNADNDESDINIKCHRGFYRSENQDYYSYICTDKEGDGGNSSASSPLNSSSMNMIFNGSFLILGIFFLLFLFCKVSISFYFIIYKTIFIIIFSQMLQFIT
ncbi:hypothetical protein PVBG_05418 [Plasmodium vivax Brazil I]|uniref:Variable surface protein Vir24g n=1 Tax=Plasmodium vivax (strain Brazil I) TaxID=1033975 RepID=A0A0J9SZA9_PLAV1|nr:hypothetical protein PVBG_05418 [Plasmodium vivax Brazil I]